MEIGVEYRMSNGGSLRAVGVLVSESASRVTLRLTRKPIGSYSDYDIGEELNVCTGTFTFRRTRRSNNGSSRS